MSVGRNVLDDSLTVREWQRLRNLQIAGQNDEAEPFASAALADESPMKDWQRIRNRQVGGELDVYLPSDIKVGRFTVRPKGTYYIGQQDPPRKK